MPAGMLGGVDILGPVVGTLLYGFDIRSPYQLSLLLLGLVLVVVATSPRVRGLLAQETPDEVPAAVAA
jgi:hypothetical protein